MKRALAILAALTVWVCGAAGCGGSEKAAESSTVDTVVTTTTTEMTSSTETTPIPEVTTAATTSTTVVTERKPAPTITTTTKKTITTTTTTTTTVPASTTTQTTTDGRGQIVNGVFTASDGSFRIILPDGWTRTEASAISFNYSDYDTNRTNMNITIEPNGGTLDDITQNFYQDQMDSAFGEGAVTISSYKRISIKGKDALHIEATVEANGTRLYMAQFLIDGNNADYTLTYVSLNFSDDKKRIFKFSASSFQEL